MIYVSRSWKTLFNMKNIVMAWNILGPDPRKDALFLLSHLLNKGWNTWEQTGHFIHIYKILNLKRKIIILFCYHTECVWYVWSHGSLLRQTLARRVDLYQQKSTKIVTCNILGPGDFCQKSTKIVTCSKCNILGPWRQPAWWEYTKHCDL